MGPIYFAAFAAFAAFSSSLEIGQRNDGVIPSARQRRQDKDGLAQAPPKVMTHLAFNSERYSVHAIPHVDWNGTRYWSGIRPKFMAWSRGHTFQLAMRAAERSQVCS